MVLVSHTHRFIYLKTKKTASTSVEGFFEPYCVADPAKEIVQYRDEEISDTGIVGCRLGRAERARATYHAHMGAWDLLKALGLRRWRAYCKFTTVRNPFDKTVSEFLYRNRNKPDLITCPMDERRGHFSDWLATYKLPSDRYIYAIAGRPIVQGVIRYERLGDDILRICKLLGIAPDLNRLPGFKRDAATPREPYAAYYTDASRAAVARAYAPELKRFGYTFEGAEQHAA